MYTFFYKLSIRIIHNVTDIFRPDPNSPNFLRATERGIVLKK